MRISPLIPFLLLTAPALGQAATPLTVEEVLSRHVEARGGRETLAQTESLRLRGTLDIGGLAATMTLQARRPNQLHIEVQADGRKEVRAWDGTAGWAALEQQNRSTPQVLEGKDLELLRRQADFDGPLVDPAAKGHRVELVPGDGREDSLVRLRILRADGSVLISLLDPGTWLEVRQEFSTQLGGQPVEVIVTLDDYREVQGLLLPHSITQAFVGHTVGTKFTVTSVEVDVDLDDHLFLKPTAKPKASG